MKGGSHHAHHGRRHDGPRRPRPPHTARRRDADARGERAGHRHRHDVRRLVRWHRLPARLDARPRRARRAAVHPHGARARLGPPHPPTSRHRARAGGCALDAHHRVHRRHQSSRARLAQHLRHPPAHAVQRPVVLRRWRVHHRSLAVGHARARTVPPAPHHAARAGVRRDGARLHRADDRGERGGGAHRAPRGVRARDRRRTGGDVRADARAAARGRTHHRHDDRLPLRRLPLARARR